METRPTQFRSNPDAGYRDAIDLLRGIFFNFLGMLMRVGKILFLFVAAHFYGTAALGLYFLAWSAVDLAGKFGLWGLDRSLLRDVARLQPGTSPESRREILASLAFHIRLALLLSVAAGVLMFFASPYIALFVFSDAALAGPLRILSFAIPFTVLTMVAIAATKGLRQMQYEAFIRQGLEPGVLLAATLLLIPSGAGAVALAWAHLTASLVAAIASTAMLVRKFRHLGWPPQHLPQPQQKQILRYTAPIALMDFLNLLVARTDILLVGALIHPAAAGLYGIAVEIISIIKRVRQGFEPIFAPIVAELYHHREKERLQRNYVLVTRWLMAGSFLPVTALVIFPEQILALFGIESGPAVLTLQVLALAHGIFGAFSAAENLLVMTGRTLLNTVLGGGMLAINIAAGWLLIPAIGLPGAAVGTLLAFFAVNAARIYFGYRRVGVLPFGTALWWPLVTTVATVGGILLLQRWWPVQSPWQAGLALFLMSVLYLLIYFGGAREPEEKFLIQRLRKKFRSYAPVSN